LSKPVSDPFTDAASRIKYDMDLHAVAGSSGWAAFALADGSSDHTAYDTWSDAVKSKNWDRDNYMYLEIQPDGMPSVEEAKRVLHYARTIHTLGHRIPSPDWEHYQSMSMPYQSWDRARMAKQLASGKPLDANGYSNLPATRKAI
jgi:hypothetical protein